MYQITLTNEGLKEFNSYLQQTLHLICRDKMFAFDVSEAIVKVLKELSENHEEVLEQVPLPVCFPSFTKECNALQGLCDCGDTHIVSDYIPLIENCLDFSWEEVLNNRNLRNFSI